MGIKQSKQTTVEPYPESYHGSSTGLTETKDNWILVQSNKLNKMKKKVMLRKDSASMISNMFNTRDPKECMANTSNPTNVNSINNSTLYAYKVHKTHTNFTKAIEEKQNQKGKHHKGPCNKQNKTGNNNKAWNLMDIKDMHQFIKHLNYTIVLLDLVRNKANSPASPTKETIKHYKPANKKMKRNTNPKKVRSNK